MCPHEEFLVTGAECRMTDGMVFVRRPGETRFKAFVEGDDSGDFFADLEVVGGEIRWRTCNTRGLRRASSWSEVAGQIKENLEDLKRRERESDARLEEFGKLAEWQRGSM